MADPKDTLTRFAKAVLELLDRADLVYADPGEQAITATLAALMGPHFPGWTVSPEWDRREQEEKKLAYGDVKGAARLRKIRPDIIVHHVGKAKNLLVVEAKRHINRDYEDDIGKLRGMTDLSGLYHYEVGVHLILNIQKQAVVGCEVYINGAVDSELTASLRDQLP